MTINTKNHSPKASAARRKPRKGNAAETDYVAHEAAEAKSAVLASIDTLKTTAVNSLDIRRWAQRYPVRTAGAALLAGFALAAVAKGSHHVLAQSDDGSSTDESPSSSEPKQATSDGEPSSQNAFIALIIAALVDVLRVAAQNFLLNAFNPRQTSAPPQVDQSNESENAEDMN